MSDERPVCQCRDSNNEGPLRPVTTLHYRYCPLYDRWDEDEPNGFVRAMRFPDTGPEEGIWEPCSPQLVRLTIGLEYDDGTVNTLTTEGPIREVTCKTQGRYVKEPVSPYAILPPTTSWDLNVSAIVMARESDGRGFTVTTSRKKEPTDG